MEAFIRVRWEGNNSRRYDGSVQDIESKYVVSGTVDVGGCSLVKMGKSKKLWNAVVIDLLDTEDDGCRRIISPELSDDDAGKQGFPRW